MRMLYAVALSFFFYAGLLVSPGWCQDTAIAAARSQPAYAHRAAQPATDPELAIRARTNNWTVSLLSSTITGTHIRMASDLQMALDDGENLRVVPMLGQGERQNVHDLLYLKGVDLAYTYADVFEELKKEGRIKNIEQRIQYISVGQVSALNILVRSDIKTLKDLEGKKFGMSNGASVTGGVLFSRLKIKVEPVEIDAGIALEKMKTGELVGMLHLLPKGHEFLAKIPPELGYHLLNIDYDDRFSDYYLPYTLDPGTYPSLMKPDEQVETIAVPSVLAVFNWPRDTDRYRRVQRFVEHYFARFDQLKTPPFHAEWKNISLGAKVPGWVRFSAAQEMLEKLQSGKPIMSASTAPTVRPNSSASEEPAVSEELYSEFLEWKKKQKK